MQPSGDKPTSFRAGYHGMSYYYYSTANWDEIIRNIWLAKALLESKSRERIFEVDKAHPRNDPYIH